MPNNFQNKSFSTPLQEPKVISQETICVEHRDRSGTGRGSGTPKPAYAESSDGLGAHMQEDSLHFSGLKKNLLVSVHWNSAAVTMESLESESQWAVRPDF